MQKAVPAPRVGSVPREADQRAKVQPTAGLETNKNRAMRSAAVALNLNGEEGEKPTQTSETEAQSVGVNSGNNMPQLADTHSYNTVLSWAPDCRKLLIEAPFIVVCVNFQTASLQLKIREQDSP